MGRRGVQVAIPEHQIRGGSDLERARAEQAAREARGPARVRRQGLVEGDGLRGRERHAVRAEARHGGRQSEPRARRLDRGIRTERQAGARVA
jgi:hypothetical protein